MHRAGSFTWGGYAPYPDINVVHDPIDYSPQQRFVRGSLRYAIIASSVSAALSIDFLSLSVAFYFVLMLKSFDFYQLLIY
jgi:hypothetical protein